MSKKELELTRKAIGEVLAKLNVIQVVYIDDIFDLEKSQYVNRVIGWFAEVWQKSPGEAEKLMPEVRFDAPYEVWAQVIRSQWEILEDGERQEVVKKLLELLQIDSAKDLEYAHRLREMFPEDMSFQEFSPSDWLLKENDILGGVSATSKVLCLFDHDLQYAEGFTSAGSMSGIGLLKKAVRENVMCALLTHTIPRVEDELASWRELAENNDVELDRFLPLAKTRLDAPLDFADGIKKTTLNIFCEKLKDIAIDVFGEACKEATSKLKKLDPYDFEYIVLQASYRESMWEADTLMRLFRIFHRDSIRERILETRRSQAFNEAVQIARPISAIKARKGDIDHPWKVLGVRQQELYEDSNLIRYSPLETGDLFTLESKNGMATQEFLLLAQPCDLMVRQNGKRRSTVAPFVPIKKQSRKEVDKKKETYWRTRARLDYLYENPEDNAILEFGRAFWIDLDVLDLAVLDKDGNCRLKLDPNTLSLNALPSWLTEGWGKRFKELIERFREHRECLDELDETLDAIQGEHSRERLWQYVMPRMCSGSDIPLPKPPYSNGVFDFGFRRIKRYRRPGVDKLLRAYTHYLSRDADEPDFARVDRG